MTAKKQQTPKWRIVVTNSFGVIGYLLVSLQWLLAVLVYFEWLTTWLLVPQQSEPMPAEVATPAAGGEVPLWGLVIMGVITAVMVTLAIYFMIKVPIVIAKTGKKIVRNASEQAAPLMLKAQHRKDTPKNRKQLTPKLFLVFKIALILIPLCLALGSYFIEEKSLSFSLVVLLSAGTALLSTVLFTIQYLLGWILKVKRELFW